MAKRVMVFPNGMYLRCVEQVVVDGKTYVSYTLHTANNETIKTGYFTVTKLKDGYEADAYISLPTKYVITNVSGQRKEETIENMFFAIYEEIQAHLDFF